jgi:hypothetical protein
MFTMGSGDKSVQSYVNWYNSSRGLYDIALTFVQADSYGCIAARLCEVSISVMNCRRMH